AFSTNPMETKFRSTRFRGIRIWIAALWLVPLWALISGQPVLRALAMAFCGTVLVPGGFLLSERYKRIRLSALIGAGVLWLALLVTLPLDGRVLLTLILGIWGSIGIAAALCVVWLRYRGKFQARGWTW